MSKYKIGIIAKDILNKKFTGIENYTINMIEEFDKTDEFKFYLYTNHPYKKKFKNVKIKYLKNKKAWIHTSLYKELMKDNIDLVFSPTPSLPLIKNKTIKQVITVHDLFFKYMSERVKTTKFFMKRAVIATDKIIAVSNYTKKEILNNYKGVNEKKIKVIYESYNKKVFRKSKRKEEKNVINILSVGTITTRKNFTQIVKILPIIKEEFGEVKLNIIGKKGDDYDNLIKTIIDFKCKENVNISGYVSNDILKEEYLKNNVFVYTSKEEGFGIPLLEAFAMGIPTVTSDNSALKEIGEKASILVDPNNIMDIATGVIEAIRRSNDLRELGFIEARKYSWKKTAKLTLDTFRELLNEKTSS